MPHPTFEQYLEQEIEQMCRLALNEDLPGSHGKDISAELIDASSQANATLITREKARFCGARWLEIIYHQLEKKQASENHINHRPMQIKWHKKDGEFMQAGQVICELSGNARQLLTGERSAMNFLQTLSATATLTHQYVQQMNHPHCRLLDTRKTLPGMRFAQKYAVRCGGGSNHRMGLTDAFLIKENHIMACGSIKKALTKAIEMYPNKRLEIEVENLDQLKQAIKEKTEVILLDNFENDQLLKAVSIRNQTNPNILLEASGNVSLNTIAAIAKTGVDYISVGALTKDIKAVDLSLRVVLG